MAVENATNCPACANWRGGQYRTGCRGCQVRQVARGPHYWASKQAGTLTREYRAQLAAIDTDINVAHQAVRAQHEALTKP